MEWLIAVTGLPFDILILVLLAVAGAFAGFLDSAKVRAFSRAGASKFSSCQSIAVSRSCITHRNL